MQVELTDRELAQLLAALRNGQTDALNEDLIEAFSGHFEPTRRSATRRSTTSASDSTSPGIRS